MKKRLSLLAITLFTAYSNAALVNLNLDEFQKTFKSLNKAQGYNGEINSDALTGKAYEKFIVTGSSHTDEREPVLMTGYYMNPTELGTLYSITQYRVYCDDETYSYALSNFEPNGALSTTTMDSDYGFEYENPSARDQKFSKILKNACKHPAK
ncbi:hypothetical protein GCM10025882_08130 [Acinetobacter gyllenbergii]|uniref:Uncharacterized protein n=1 Tax=Acinetobacter gyllenbergii CIP 110306 = MTCC 11365 TaxID=1217657 RepID=A0A829HNI9_9GAMM|nr:hypothetical protein [Acinetobacter gyllenbergii]EPF94567.1 hypothetical protein F957_00022 [Acinetobacter gyllenbergii CIP 110306 = MTCC 11365]EPH30759.1 hypothetical protein L293_2945 [Acinetobacter gyllenbergii CIP 110306 = MTCC 11365]ESK38589.1 hypothetical protein F987_03170 [Acinetobacter gyllenbergii NIPH 230]MCU4582789.1 hypothetical protein [Acinetobacter gyllenbergii]OBY72389.1 hypothetical protein NG55_20070 [Acinetobacter gyllenbergii]